MEFLPHEATIEIIKHVYPTELINICLVSKHFSSFSSDERLFRVFLTTQFQLPQFATSFTFKLPPTLTWKELFIKLFNTKRQMISTMYSRMGLVYEYDYKPISEQELRCLHYDDDIDIVRNGRATGDFHSIVCNMSVNERIKLGCISSTLSIDGSPIEGAIVDRLAFYPDYTYSLNIEDVMYRRNLLKSEVGENGIAQMDKILLYEGFCVWEKQSQTYIPVYPTLGFRCIFYEYRKCIMEEYTKKFHAACKILNEEVTVMYECPQLTAQNFTTYERDIEKEFEKQNWTIIIYGYGYRGLSLLISRYPKSLLPGQGDRTMSQYDFDRMVLCNLRFYTHKNEDFHPCKLLEYSSQPKLEVPKTITINSAIIGLEEDPIVLTLIESETQIYPSRISHVKDNTDTFEDPYNDDSDDSSFGIELDNTTDYTEDEGDNELIDF